MARRKGKGKISPIESKSKPSRFTVSEDSVDYELTKPVFSLERLVSGKHCFSNLNKEDKLSFVESIFKRKDFSWKDIKQQGRHQLGFEKIARDSIKVAIPNTIPPDRDHFLAFRYNGKKAMIGYRNKTIFYVLWFDHDFKVYSHG